VYLTTRAARRGTAGLAASLPSFLASYLRHVHTRRYGGRGRAGHAQAPAGGWAKEEQMSLSREEIRAILETANYWRRTGWGQVGKGL